MRRQRESKWCGNVEIGQGCGGIGRGCGDRRMDVEIEGWI